MAAQLPGRAPLPVQARHDNRCQFGGVIPDAPVVGRRGRGSYDGPPAGPGPRVPAAPGRVSCRGNTPRRLTAAGRAGSGRPGGAVDAASYTWEVVAASPAVNWRGRSG